MSDIVFNMKRLSIVNLKLSQDKYIYKKLYDLFSLCKEEKNKNGIIWYKGNRAYIVYDNKENALHFSSNLMHVLKSEFNIAEHNVYNYIKIFMEFNTKLNFDSVRCT